MLIVIDPGLKGHLGSDILMHLVPEVKILTDQKLLQARILDYILNLFFFPKKDFKKNVSIRTTATLIIS